MSTEQKKQEGLNIDKKTLFGIAGILLAILIIAGALTQFLPRGEFQVDENGSVIAGPIRKTPSISCRYGRSRLPLCWRLQAAMRRPERRS